MRELELKFQVPASMLRSLQDEFKRRGARSTRLAATYYDTPDRRLGRNGIALRLRKEGRRWVQALKVASENPIDRLEHEVTLRVAPGTLPVLDMARHDGTPCGVLLRQALGDDGMEQLVPAWSTDVLRRACRLQLAQGEVEAALDVGQVQAGARSLPLAELELELKSGTPAALFDLALAWRAHGGLWLDTRSKAQRGATLSAGVDHGEPVRSQVPQLDPTMDGASLQRAVLRGVMAQVLGNASEVAAGSRDGEHLHQLRVGLRRLKTALRELATLSLDLPAQVPAPVAQLFEVLGQARDDDAVGAAVRPLLEQAGAPRTAWDPAVEPASAPAALREAAVQDALLELLRLAYEEEPASATGLSPEDAREHLQFSLARLYRRVARGAGRFESLPVADQHRLRRRLKRLRYLSDFVQTLWPEKATRRFLRQLLATQDVLGRHNDVAVAAERFSQEALSDPRSWFAAGWLTAHLRVTARECSQALKDLKRAAPFWRDVRR